MDPLRCILPSGLYLVLHQFSALHSYTPHELQSHRVSAQGGVLLGCEEHPNPAPASLPRHSPGLLQSPDVPEHSALGLGRSRSHQLRLSWCCCSGDHRSCVRAAEGSACLRARLFHSSLSGISELGHVRIISCSLLLFLIPTNSEGYHSTSVLLFTDKILFDHHILVPVADLPFPHKSFSTEKLQSTAGICEAVTVTGYFTPHPWICEKI